MLHALLSILSSKNWTHRDIISIISGTLLLVQLLDLAHLLNLGRIKCDPLCWGSQVVRLRHTTSGCRMRLTLFRALISASSFQHVLRVLACRTRFRVTQTLAISVHTSKVSACDSRHLSLLALSAIRVRIPVGIKSGHVSLELLLLLRVPGQRRGSTTELASRTGPYYQLIVGSFHSVSIGGLHAGLSRWHPFSLYVLEVHVLESPRLLGGHRGPCQVGRRRVRPLFIHELLSFHSFTQK